MDDLHLKIEEMDVRHDEFLILLKQVKTSEKEDFLILFEQMIEHTKEHFSYEEELMRKKNYYGLEEHLHEHTNLLEEMNFFFQKSKKVSALGYSYIDDYAYDKFRRHIINIDSQLAMFLKEK